jgi:hypothetical protein
MDSTYPSRGKEGIILNEIQLEPQRQIDKTAKKMVDFFIWVSARLEIVWTGFSRSGGSGNGLNPGSGKDRRCSAFFGENHNSAKNGESRF